MARLKKTTIILLSVTGFVVAVAATSGGLFIARLLEPNRMLGQDEYRGYETFEEMSMDFDRQESRWREHLIQEGQTDNPHSQKRSFFRIPLDDAFREVPGYRANYYGLGGRDACRALGDPCPAEIIYHHVDPMEITGSLYFDVAWTKEGDASAHSSPAWIYAEYFKEALGAPDPDLVWYNSAPHTDHNETQSKLREEYKFANFLDEGRRSHLGTFYSRLSADKGCFYLIERKTRQLVFQLVYQDYRSVMDEADEASQEHYWNLVENVKVGVGEAADKYLRRAAI